MKLGKVGKNRLILKGTKIWSINNQTFLILDEDTIVEVKNTCIGSDQVFVKPKQLIFNLMGFIPTLIGKGTDEWEISYSKTLPYTIPEAKFEIL